MDAFFQIDGDGFVPTPLTIGPWSTDFQHGGPPSALLGRALERWGDGGEVARVAIDFVRPIPVRARLTISVEPANVGRAVQRLRARLLADGEEVARADAVRIRRSPGTAPDVRPGPRLPPLPPASSFEFPFFSAEIGYHRAIEVRYVRGAFGDNPVSAWMRQLVPVLPGEAPSGFQRVLVLVDAESGVCPPVDVANYTFVNPDLVVLLDRAPDGPWIGLDVTSSSASDGVGLAQAAVHDHAGPVGRSAQTLLVARR